MNEYTWRDIHIGLKHEFEATFSAQDAQSFAALSGDTNPLHVDEAYAGEVGYPGPVLFGMMTSSLYSRLIGVYLPGKFALFQGIDVTFSAPVYAGEMLRVAGEVVVLSEAYRRFQVKGAIRKVDGTLVSRAMMWVGFHGK